MLFHYAVEATEDNWLHDVTLAMLLAGMDELDAGQQLTAWPNCIPVARRNALAAKTGFRDRRIALLNAYAALSPQARAVVREALALQNAIPAIFDGLSPWMRLMDLPVSIHEPAKEFFRFAFGLLTPLGLRDQHYRVVYQNLPAKICPFCGLERLSHPNQPRPDLDHYLLITSYPFAGVNLRNLAPMGDRCNTAFKGMADVIFDVPSNSRRKCGDPYSGPIISISLNDTDLFSEDATLRPRPYWAVELAGEDPHCASTWNSVFQIERRYTDLLNEEYYGWVSHFGRWCADLRSAVELTDNASVVSALDQYLETTLQEGLADLNFLKRAAFQMLRTRCEAGPGSQRLIDWLKEIVSGYRPAIAA